MLVLAIAPDGVVQIGEDIFIKNVGKGKVKIGFDAPKTVRIMRIKKDEELGETTRNREGPRGNGVVTP
jgi:sRNA-binding carbon storage regulator CsrA